MPNDDSTSYFRLIREDLMDFRKEVNERLDKLVTQDAFDGERRRVDGLIARLGQDLVAEAAARREADAAEEVARRKVVDELEQKGARTGLWVRWTVGLIIGIPSTVGALIALTTILSRR